MLIVARIPKKDIEQARFDKEDKGLSRPAYVIHFKQKSSHPAHNVVDVEIYIDAETGEYLKAAHTL